MKHVVKPGETLSSIALKYGFKSIDAIYNHAENEDFRERRSNPDVIYEGDSIFIPDMSPAKFSIEVNRTNRFTVSLPKEILSMHLVFEDDVDQQGANIEAVLIIDDIEYPAKSDGDALVQWKIPRTNTRKGLVKLFLESDKTEATHVFEVLLGDLNPVSENTGIQARLNNLGFNCGKVDNNIKEKSISAIKKFQEANNLTVDGVPGPKTLKALEDKYGC